MTILQTMTIKVKGKKTISPIHECWDILQWPRDYYIINITTRLFTARMITHNVSLKQSKSVVYHLTSGGQISYTVARYTFSVKSLQKNLNFLQLYLLCIHYNMNAYRVGFKRFSFHYFFANPTSDQIIYLVAVSFWKANVKLKRLSYISNQF